MKKISHRIITAIILCSITISSFIGVFSILKSTRVIRSQSETIMKEMGKSQAEAFNVELTKTENIVSNLNSLTQTSFDVNKISDEYIIEYKKTLKDYIKYICDNQGENFIGLYVHFSKELTGKDYEVWYADTTGYKTFEFQPEDEDVSMDENNESLKWYFGPLKDKKPFWSDPYMDTDTNQSMITYSMPLIVDNKVLGVIGADISLDKLKFQILSLAPFDNGYAFLLDSNLNYIVHKTLTQKDNIAKVDGGSLKLIADKMKEKPSGVEYYTYKNDKKILSYETLSNGWVLSLCSTEKDIFKELNKVKIVIATVMVFGIAISILVALVVSLRITRPLNKVTKLIDKTSNLELDYNKEYENLLKLKDETGIIAKSVFNLRKNLREMVDRLQGSSKKTTNFSQDLAEASKEMTYSLDSVVTTLDELSKGTQEQASEAQSSTEALMLLGDEINQANDVSLEVKEVINNVVVNSEKGVSAISNLDQKMNLNSELTNKVSNSIEDLKEKSNHIGSIITTISSIAEQTNLLALNAAIEAARAGEAGRGFSVVAEEIRKLSEETANSTIEITKLVQAIENTIFKTKDDMDKTVSSNLEANIALKDSSEAFKEINSSINNTIEKIDMLIENIEKINDDKEKAISSIQEIAAISEQSAASTEEVAANSEEQLSQMEAVSKTAEELKLVVQELENITNLFKL